MPQSPKCHRPAPAGAAAATLLALAVLSTGLIPEAAQAARSDELPDVTHDGLERIETKNVAVAWVKPDADFSVYRRLAIVECEVAFRRNWQRDQNRGRSPSRYVSDADVEEIREGMAALFLQVFSEELAQRGGYEFTTEAAPDVLLLRPAIIDLDVAAPDVDGPGRTRTFVTSAGSATLFLELYDTVSGEILARVMDRREGRDYGRMQMSSRVSNSVEAKRIIGNWARLLRNRLDEVMGPEAGAAAGDD
jgi:hypothetical protein